MRKNLLLVCLLVCASAVYADMYKCTTSNGSTAFQDAPCANESKSQKLESSAAAGGLPWSGLKLGMSREQISRTLPGVNLVSDGADGLNMANGASIAGFKFHEAGYAFSGGALYKITLVSEYFDNALVAKGFEKISALFNQQYGASHEERKFERKWSGLFGSWTWRGPNGGEVYLSVSPVTADSSMLLTGYKSAGSR